ncbi:hypothetical protein ACIZ62_18610 [Acetobacterium carbinolicum]|uniref:hypothetical protein n=1 Tax=Acetobacterium carbinolicum TaxID=52690 RepID=UPI0039BF52EA
MTSLTDYSVNFNKNLKVSFNGGDLSSDAGLLIPPEQGYIAGILIFYQNHFEYANIINQTYLDIEYFYEKDDHFVLVSNSRKMVFLIKKTQFLQGNSEMFGQFINHKRNHSSKIS